MTGWKDNGNRGKSDKMLSDIASQLSGNQAVVSTIILLLAATYILPNLVSRNVLLALPTIEDERVSVKKRRQQFNSSAKELYVNGYQKFKDAVFRITTAGDQHVVVPPKYLPELKRLPDDVLNLHAAFEETFENKYTAVIFKNPILIHTVKVNLTLKLAQIGPTLAKEASRAIREEIPQCEDWTRVKISQKLLRIVAKVSGSVFVGSSVCRDEEYIDATINYTVEVAQGARQVKDMSPWKRPFFAHSLPGIKELKRRKAQFSKLLRPIIAKRLEAAKSPTYETPDDLLQWLMNNFEDSNNLDAKLMAEFLCSVNFAGIHSTSTTTLNLIYNLAAAPEHIGPLREEIRTVLSEHNSEFNQKALQSLKKLDSCIMETNRLNPLNWTIFIRKVQKGFTVSNGQHIPAGVILEVSQQGIHRDPEVHVNPEMFDGFRFYRLRTDDSVKDANRQQAVSVTTKNLAFGYGKNACPGRFFAVNQIKLIIAHLILQYDFKTTEDAGERYENLEFGANNIPDPSKDILFKKI